MSKLGYCFVFMSKLGQCFVFMSKLGQCFVCMSKLGQCFVFMSKLGQCFVFMSKLGQCCQYLRTFSFICPPGSEQPLSIFSIVVLFFMILALFGRVCFGCFQSIGPFGSNKYRVSDYIRHEFEPPQGLLCSLSKRLSLFNIGWFQEWIQV